MFFVFSCSAPKKTVIKNDYPLSLMRAYTSDGSMSVKIPKGWASADDNAGKFDIWIFDNGMNNSIVIQEFEISDSVKEIKNTRQKLSEVLKFSESSKKEAILNKDSAEKDIFSLNGKEFGAYEYRSKEGFPVRVMVFCSNEGCFELSALSVNSSFSDSLSASVLFRVQQSVAGSLKF